MLHKYEDISQSLRPSSMLTDMERWYCISICQIFTRFSRRWLSFAEAPRLQYMVGTRHRIVRGVGTFLT